MEYLSKASLLVHPSFYEGFGLPPLEALVLGTPTLISNIPVFREIYNDFPVTFFRTGDCMDLKVNIIKLLKENLSLPDLSDELLHRYTFEKIASKILKELE
jgi:glycosyltransferase involved in cell wall biosynthesis